MTRAARALLLVANSRDGCSTTEVAGRIGVAVPTAFHLLNTLVDEQLLAKDRKRYYLGPAAAQIADGFIGPEPVTTSLSAPLRQLAEVTLETAYLCVWRHGEVVVVGSIAGAQAVNVEGTGIGVAECAHARASGKMILATLDEAALDAYLAVHPLRAVTQRTLTDEGALRQELRRTRNRGYSLDQEEFREGVSCIGVPIMNGATLYGVYALSLPVSRLRPNRDRYLEALRSAAAHAVTALSATAYLPKGA